MIFLGLDISSKVTGWSIIECNGPGEEPNLISFGEIKLESFKKKSFPLEYVKVLYEELSALILLYKPNIVYLEDIFNRNILTFKSLARMRGVCEAACLNAQIKYIFEVKSSTARNKVLGKGNLDKEQVCTILEARFKKPIATAGFDQSDSILIGLYGAKIYEWNKQKKPGSDGRKSRTTKPNDSNSKKTK